MFVLRRYECLSAWILSFVIRPVFRASKIRTSIEKRINTINQCWLSVGMIFSSSGLFCTRDKYRYLAGRAMFFSFIPYFDSHFSNLVFASTQL